MPATETGPWSDTANARPNEVGKGLARGYCRRIAQLPLFAAGSGRSLLFETKALDQYLSGQQYSHIDRLDDRIRACATWVANLKAVGKVTSKAVEEQFEASFANLLVDLLDYRLYPSANASLWAKPGRQFTALQGTPDLVLGDFSNLAAPQFRAVFELKTPSTDLDKPQLGRADRLSPVQQAFDYGRHLLGVRWVLVSDMYVVRLYSVDNPFHFEQFDLTTMTKNEFRKLWWLLSSSSFMSTGDDSDVDLLLAKSSQNRISLSNGFYEAYSAIRQDIYEAIQGEVLKRGIHATRERLLTATQRLLDRMLFIFYCEDHPHQLIGHDTVKNLTTLAASLPGGSTTRVYEQLKALFREVDSGSPAASGLKVPAYNGELFKVDPIIDTIELPDSLHTRRYPVNVGNLTRVIQGAWGLHIFDFWRELDEHMLGKVFEESLSDLVSLGTAGGVPLASKMKERKRGGVYYTTELLAEFATEQPLRDVIAQKADTIAAHAGADARDPSVQLEALSELRVADLTCGSGAFVVSAYRFILAEYWRQREILDSLGRGPDLFSQAQATNQATLLRDCVFGVDLLPQAVEIAKLALWLRSAKRDEKVPDLSSNFAAHDALDVVGALNRLSLAPGELDLVIGNPPWGAEMDQTTRATACAVLRLNPATNWDTWELFLLLGLHALRPGGRLCFILPDSLLYEQKEPIREYLVENTQIMRVHALGPNWFGAHVRMNTMLLDVRKSPPGMLNDYRAISLAGPRRKAAQSGRLPLTQLETQRGRAIPQERSAVTDNWRFELLRTRADDHLIEKMVSNSVPLGELCDRSRGEEMSKSGLYWECPSCSTPNVPGRKSKGGGLESKTCIRCGAKLDAETAHARQLVEAGPAVPDAYDSYVDGDDLTRRYGVATPSRRMRLNLPGWSYKPDATYRDEKILIRQAGVGIVATLDRTGARCPQSLYVYRLKPHRIAEGWTHEYVLSALLSRTMAYVLFKRFGEIDPDKAHAKVTHQRLAALPIPVLDWTQPRTKQLVSAITERVTNLLGHTDKLGGTDDRDVELDLRSIWGIAPDEGAYINGEFFDMPTGQAIRDLFPTGAPDPRQAPTPVGAALPPDVLTYQSN